MSNIYDLRIKKTRESIEKAFIELTAKKGFEALTVKDITEKAQINRSTFYSHYVDKYDLLTHFQDELIHHMNHIIVSYYQEHDLVIGHESQYETFQTISVLLYDYMTENRDLVKILFSMEGDISFYNRLKKLFREFLFDEGKLLSFDASKLMVPTNYFVSYFTAAFFSITKEWVVEGCKKTPEEMAHILSSLTIRNTFYSK